MSKRMSRRNNKRSVPKSGARLGSARRYEYVFAALGDGTRLALVAKLSSGETYSISGLTSGSRLTRQAITKHLRVLERAGLVHSLRRGRESLFEFDAKPIVELKDYLEMVSRNWDERLARLKNFVEKA